MNDDDAPARGCCLGLIISVLAWTVIALAVLVIVTR